MAKRRFPKQISADGFDSLSNNDLIQKARAAGIKAAKDAMSIMGYVVIAENGFIIKKYADGRKDILSAIPVNRLQQDKRLG